MGLAFTQGDITQTRAQGILVGLNMRGKADVSPLEVALRDQAPVFFSEYRRLARQGELSPGMVWFFRDAQPWYIGAVLRGVPGGATRTRHLETALLTLRQRYAYEQLTSLAIAPLGTPEEWPLLRQVILDQLASLPLPIVVYQTYSPGQAPQEPATF